MRDNRQGMLIVLSGPSGSGKDTVLDELKDTTDDVQISISLTTRDKRPWEFDGVHYYFVTREYFEEKLQSCEILEFTQYNGNYYGTPKTTVDEWLAEGKTVILKIEVEGAANVREIYPDCISVFLMPPSLEVLRQRLRNRESETEADIAPPGNRRTGASPRARLRLYRPQRPARLRCQRFPFYHPRGTPAQLPAQIYDRRSNAGLKNNRSRGGVLATRLVPLMRL